MTIIAMTWNNSAGMGMTENILLLNGAWRLTDFGIARYATAATSSDTRRYFMTHDYAAPEQWRGDTATAETDVYALGIVAFELLTGSRPFTGSNLREQHLAQPVPPMTGVAPHLATIIQECLYKEPGARPQPGNLVHRLEKQTAPVTASGRGLAALQQASLAQAASHGDEIRRYAKITTDAGRRTALQDAAPNQMRMISEELKQTMAVSTRQCILAG